MSVMRRAAAVATGVLAMAVLMVGPATAQVVPPYPPVVAVEEEVLPAVEVRPAAEVRPAVVRPAAEVRPAVIPRTGGDIGLEALAGLGLTGAGLALAAGARWRRQRVATG